MTDEEQTTPEPAQLPMDPSQVRTATVAELGRLDAFVQGLSLDSWSKPSAVPGWTVGDVVAHLNLVLALSGRLVDAVVSGKGSGSVWRALDRVGQRVGPVAGRAFDALNTSLPRVIDRALSPEVIKGQLATSARTFGEKLARVESGDYTRPVYYRGGPWPLSFFLSAVLAELAIHGWDIASRLDPHAHLSDDARLVLPWFFWSGTPFMLRLPKAHPEGKVQVSLADLPVRMWWSIGAETKQELGETSDPDATITGASGIFVLTLAGRVSAEDALRTTSLQARGREDLATAFLGSWRIL